MAQSPNNNNAPAASGQPHQHSGGAALPFTTVLNGRYQIDQLIGKGGFGDVYGGFDTESGERVAVKTEKATSRSWLYHEAKIMQVLCTFTRPTIGVPILRYFGQQGDYRVLVMSLLGPSLEDLHEQLNRFSLKTTLMLLDQMLSRLEYVHSVGFVHRDLKPDNFLMGVGRLCHHVYIIDYGLSSKYLNSQGQHREMSTGRSFVGTTRYASLRTHQGYSQSRRDDLEQLAYIAVYMYRGGLPWSGLQIKNRDEKEKVIGDMKSKLSVNQICHKCPQAFASFLSYARKMEWADTPEYEMCRALFRSVLEELHETIDYKFDWVRHTQPAEVRSPMVQPIVSSEANGRGMLSGGVLSNAEIASMQLSPKEQGHDQPLADENPQPAA